MRRTLIGAPQGLSKMARGKYIPELLQEAIVLGFWGAATVKVAGYTWESITQTWSSLPSTGGDDLAKQALASVTPSNSIVGGVFSANPFEIIRGLANQFGLGPKVTEGKPYAGQGGDPSTAMKKAIASGDKKTALIIAKQLANWAGRQSGWGGRGNYFLGFWLKQNNLQNQFHRLTGIWAGDLMSGKTSLPGVSTSTGIFGTGIGPNIFN